MRSWPLRLWPEFLNCPEIVLVLCKSMTHRHDGTQCSLHAFRQAMVQIKWRDMPVAGILLNSPIATQRQGPLRQPSQPSSAAS